VATLIGRQLLAAIILLMFPTPGTEGIPTTLQQVRIGDVLLAPNTGMSPPIALVFPAPAYTFEALQAGIQGTVTVRAEFDIEGNVRALEVVDGLGYGLDEAALNALGRWRFRPAYRSGRRVPVVANVDVEFRRPFSMSEVTSYPRIASRVEPSYSEEARRARHQGTVVLDTIVRSDGTTDVLGVLRGVGFGLDQKAAEALRQWRFDPATREYYVDRFSSPHATALLW
jgi:TonB family protein